MRVLVIITYLFFSFTIAAQEVRLALGLNTFRASYLFTYEEENNSSNYYYSNNDTYKDVAYSFGPSARLWYTHEFGGRFDLITGIEGSLGLVPGDGSLLNGFFFDIPIFVGSRYFISDKFSAFSTIGASYDQLISYQEIQTIFTNLEIGLEINTNNNPIILKARFGKLYYQINSFYNYDNSEGTSTYRGSLFQLGAVYPLY